MFSRRARASVVLTLALVGYGAFADAGVLTVDWDVVPHASQHIEPGDSPYYTCEGDRYTDRRCVALWQQGLELGAVTFSFYDDKWFDGYGIGDAQVGRIQPRCEAALAPCFTSFTPLELRIEGAADGGPFPNLLLLSSRGGRIEVPSLRGVQTIRLSGDLWRDLAWMTFGFYVLDVCSEDDPPDDLCEPSTEKALVVGGLTFEPIPPVPEPSAWILTWGGVAGALARSAWRRRVSPSGSSRRPSPR